MIGIGILISFAIFITEARGADIFYDWDLAIATNFTNIRNGQQVITINGMFPGPVINATTNDTIHVNIVNHLDEPFLMTWNGLKQRQNSWQDGVSGTNCPIQPRKNWTYVIETRDQIGTFFYFPSINFQKAAGGYGPIRINHPNGVQLPFPKPEYEFDFLIGDWSDYDYKDMRRDLGEKWGFQASYIAFLMNGKAPGDPAEGYNYTIFRFTQGKTYLFRISNVGLAYTFNFRIQNHTMVLVETEGTYTDQIRLDTLDVHVGQSYSVLVTADQPVADYFIEAYPSVDETDLWGEALLQYENSSTPARPYYSGFDSIDRNYSMTQARSIRWNSSAGSTWPVPQGTFNLTNVTLSQFFLLHGSKANIDGYPRYTINNVAYATPDTPLKIADHFLNGSGVYQLDAFPVNSIIAVVVNGTNVVTGVHKGWVEIVFQNDLNLMDSWHLDGFGFYVVGFGDGEWSPQSQYSYNLFNPVMRSTIQVYPGGWSAVYVYLDNPGMWNLRSQRIENWYFGQELYLRVHDADDNSTQETEPPSNLLLCGLMDPKAAIPPPALSWSSTSQPSFYIIASILVLMASWFKF